MSNYIFLYREKDTADRDCCKYIEPTYHLDCVNQVILHGACFCGRLGHTPDYSEVETVLSENDFNLIMGKNIPADDFNRIVDILQSEAGEAFFNKIVEDEKEYLKDAHDFDDDDIEQIFNEYSLDYRDRGIVGCVFDDCEDAGREYIESCCSIDSFLENYIDYARFGSDLCADENHLELSDGRVVTLNY